MKPLLRNIVSHIPGLRFWIARRIFLRSRSSLRCLGVFHSYAEAQSSIPHHLRDVPDPPIKDDYYERVPNEDWEVMRILATLIPPAGTLFDFGGYAGTSFYHYQSKITYPAAFRWIVCDLPWMTAAGRRIAQLRQETQISFTENPLEGSGVDIFLTNGAIQYLEGSLADLLAKLKDKPPYLVVNRVPMTTTNKTFFTLQHTDHHVLPYQIFNRDEFIASIKAIGYELVESWQNNRVCEVILRPDYFVPHYYGFYFKKTGT